MRFDPPIELLVLVGKVGARSLVIDVVPVSHVPHLDLFHVFHPVGTVEQPALGRFHPGLVAEVRHLGIGTVVRATNLVELDRVWRRWGFSGSINAKV